MRLYLMRHAEAEAVAADDAKRPLTPCGKHDVQQMAQFLKEYGMHFAHVMHSGKFRAEQTAELLASVLAPEQPLQVDSGLTGTDGCSSMIQKIQSWSEDTLLVSHLPFISRLLSKLVTGDADIPLVNFPPAMMVCLELCEGRRWHIKWCINPALIVRI